MANNNYQIVSLGEQERLITEIILLVETFPLLPEIIKKNGIMFSDMSPNTECMGMWSIGSAVKINQFIAGSYIGQYRFTLQYRYSTKNSKERLSKQSLLTTVGDWLGKKKIVTEDGNEFQLKEYPKTCGKNDINKIEMTEHTILIDRNASGYEDSVANFQLTYYHEN